MLSDVEPAAAGKDGSNAAAVTAAAAATGGGSTRGMSGRDLEHLQQLQLFFNSLVDDMVAHVERLALKGFNAWLVSVTICGEM